MQQIQEEDLAYIAGYLDGEGCFWVSKTGKPGISCTNTHKPTIEWLQKILGGSVHKQKGRKNNHRTTYTWQIVGRIADEFCKIICIYLKEKQPQAVGLMLSQQTMGLPLLKGKVHPRIIKERKRIAKRLKKLKGRIHG